MTVLITGAAGLIGTILRERLDRPLRLLDVVEPPAAAPGESVEILPATSVTHLPALRFACEGVDAVIHLGGIPLEDRWEKILAVNIDGTRAVLEAARQAGVPRVILASSNHAVGFERRSQAPPEGLPADVPPKPDTYYGMSKAAMEALGSLYHSRYGMDVVCLRIGSCREQPFAASELPIWLSPDDMGRLAVAALDTPAPGFRIVWGVSRNTARWWSLAEGEAIGYHPADDSAAFAADVVPDDTTDDLLGADFCRRPLGEPFTL
ncbi:NAD(P)-dependent oxidoreductase [Kribbella sp. NBC_01245]|uniref:NAD-dependent epimerase/dehydratase family protein n=1 Tax=Kribbella sp. NBC_01245 TaxID=2903578 RepID=UPI002E27EE6B|nr:NAD(P)-dependent oxidoreductase [Kribbella sp. NBC_01245]